MFLPTAEKHKNQPSVLSLFVDQILLAQDINKSWEDEEERELYIHGYQLFSHSSNATEKWLLFISYVEWKWRVVNRNVNYIQTSYISLKTYEL